VPAYPGCPGKDAVKWVFVYEVGGLRPTGRPTETWTEVLKRLLDSTIIQGCYRP